MDYPLLCKGFYRVAAVHVSNYYPKPMSEKIADLMLETDVEVSEAAEVEEEDPAVVGNALVEHRKTSGRPEMSRPGKYMLNPLSLWRNLALLSRVMRCAESQVFHAFLTTPRAAAWLHKRAPLSAQ